MKGLQDTMANTAVQDTLPEQAPGLEMGSLYEPSAVAFSFETIGWTILAIVILLSLLVIVFFLIRRYIRNAYRREALQLLEAMRDSNAAFAQIFVILKQVAIQAFGREKVGALHGREWLRFLEQTAQGVNMLTYEKQLEEVVYREAPIPDAQKKEILFNAQKWIKTHAR